MDLVDTRQASEFVERKNQWLFHQAMQHQPVIIGIDFGDPSMMTFEAQSVWRNDAVEFMQGRKAHRGLRRGGKPRDGPADDVLFVFRGLAVSADADAVAELAGPLGDMRWKIAGAFGARCGRARRGKPGSAGEKATARGACPVGRLCHRHLHGGSTCGQRSYHILFYECNRICR